MEIGMLSTDLRFQFSHRAGPTRFQRLFDSSFLNSANHMGFLIKSNRMRNQILTGLDFLEGCFWG